MTTHRRPRPSSASEEEVDRASGVPEVVPVTHDVTSFVLEPPRAGRRAGSTPASTSPSPSTSTGSGSARCYSIASPATRPDLLTITVKRVPGGPVSNWLHDHLVPGGTARGVRSARQLHTGPGARRREVPLPLRRQRDHAADVDGAHRPSTAATVADIVFVHQRPDAGRHHLPRRARPAARGRTAGIRVVVVCEEDAPYERWAGRARPDLGPRLLRGGGARPRASGRSSPADRAPYMEAVRRAARRGRTPTRRGATRRASTSRRSHATRRPRAPALPTARVESTTHSVEFRRSGRTRRRADTASTHPRSSRAPPA